MLHGFNCFSPITHSHWISIIGKLPQLDHEFWLEMDKWYVDRCNEVWVYAQPGWYESTGVNREMDWAWEQGKNVFLIDSNGYAYAYCPNREYLEDWYANNRNY